MNNGNFTYLFNICQGFLYTVLLDICPIFDYFCKFINISFISVSQALYAHHYGDMLNLGRLVLYISKGPSAWQQVKSDTSNKI